MEAKGRHKHLNHSSIYLETQITAFLAIDGSIVTDTVGICQLIYILTVQEYISGLKRAIAMRKFK